MQDDIFWLPRVFLKKLLWQSSGTHPRTYRNLFSHSLVYLLYSSLPYLLSIQISIKAIVH